MAKRLYIHDLEEGALEGILGTMPKDALVFPARPAVRHCVGCFGCWTKTPGECIIKDRCSPTPAMLAASSELVIISRMAYGGYSPDVKAVLDRSIGYIMPYFRIIGGEMHHTMRYDNPFAFTVHFYGEHISEAEQALARKLVAANAINLGAGSHRVFFSDTAEQVKEAIA